MTTKEKGTEVDPVTLSVVWNGLRSAIFMCEERVHNTAQSPLMGLMRDLGAAILNAEGDMVCGGDWAHHTFVSPTPTKHILKYFLMARKFLHFDPQYIRLSQISLLQAKQVLTVVSLSSSKITSRRLF